MNSKIQSIFVTIIAITLCNPVLSASPVWKVSREDGNTVFIGGTIHILTQSDYPLPKAFETAYAESDQIIFEVDISQTQTPAFQQKIVQVMRYPDGTTLQNFLKPEVQKLLEDYCSSRNIPLAQLSGFRPGMLAVTLMAVELQRMGLVGTGVDQYFSLRAINEGKTLDFLETIDQQISFLANMGVGYENELIEYTLKDLENISSVVSDLKGAWRSGNMDMLEELGIEPMKQTTPEIHRALISERNNNWVPAIEALFDSAQKELVLVGALHLAGDEGLLKLLGEQGLRTATN